MMAMTERVTAQKETQTALHRTMIKLQMKVTTPGPVAKETSALHRQLVLLPTKVAATDTALAQEDGEAEGGPGPAECATSVLYVKGGGS